MTAKVEFKKFLAIYLGAVVMTPLLVFFAAPMFRVLRNATSARIFWLTGSFITAIFFAAGLVPLGCLIGSTIIVVGVYGEFEQKGFGNFWTALVSVLVATAFLTFVPVLWAKTLGQNLPLILQESINNFLKMMPKQSDPTSLFSGMELDAKTLVYLLPSILFIIHLSNLATALIFDLKTARILKLKFERIATHIRLLDFRAPDALIWLTTAAFLFSFLKTGSEEVRIISQNLLNGFLGIYFFQGLAILEVLLLVLRSGPFARFFTYLIVVSQLFFVLSILGFFDYWIDFRKRIKLLGMKIKNQNNGEKL